MTTTVSPALHRWLVVHFVTDLLFAAGLRGFRRTVGQGASTSARDHCLGCAQGGTAVDARTIIAPPRGANIGRTWRFPPIVDPTRIDLLHMSPTTAVDESVRSLLRDRIDSFEQLEVLLLVGRHQERAWSVQAIAEALRLDTDTAVAALEHLVQKELMVRVPPGLAVAATSFRYHPGTPTLSQAAASLAAICEHSRIEIMNIMSTNALNRIRHQMAHVFADAFVVGRKKGG